MTGVVMRLRRPGRGPAVAIAVRLTAAVAVLGATALWGMSLAGPAGAAAVVRATSGPTSSGPIAAGPETPPTGSLTLTQQTPWVTPGQSFGMHLGISSGVPRSGLGVSVTVFDKLTSRSAFAQTLQNHDAGVLQRFGPVPVDTLPSGSAGDVDVTIPIASSPSPAGGSSESSLNLTSCSGGCEGVYPVLVELQTESGNRTLDRFTTHLVYASTPTASNKLGFTWILPAHAPPALSPDGHTSLTADESRQLSDLATSLSHHESVPVVLAPNPETMQALSESPRPTDRQTLATLASVAADPTQQVLTEPYVPVNLPGLTDVGLPDQAAAQLLRGIQVLGTTLRVPSDARTVVSNGPISQADLETLRAGGVDQLVVPDTNLVPENNKLTLTQPFQLTGRDPTQPQVTASDSGLENHFTNGGDQVLAANQLLADLAEIYFEQPGSSQPRAVVVDTPLDWSANSAFLTTALDGLSHNPIVQPLTLGSLYASVPATTPGATAQVRQLSGATPEPRVAVASLRSAERRLSSFSAVVGNDPRLVGAMGDALLVSQSSDLRPPEQSRYITGVQDQIGSQLGKLSLTQDRTVTLTARTGRIPITVISQADYTIHAVLSVASDKLSFPNGSSQVLAIDRRDNPEYFDVSARTTGDFPLTVSLASPNGDLILLDSRFTVRSTATSAVAIALSVGAGAFLLGWWGRSVIQGRRERNRRLVPSGR